MTAAVARRTHRSTLLWALAVLAVLVLVSALGLGDDSRGGALDPANAKPDGARAVAKVLDDQGVEVRVVRGQAAFLDAAVDAGTTVVVGNAADLGKSTLATLRSHASRAGDLVLVAPGSAVLDAYALSETAVDGGSFPGGCDSTLFRGLTAEVAGSAALEQPGCLRGQGGSLLRRTGSDPAAWVLTAPDVVRNGSVLDGDNAAIALRLLGQGDRVLWYVADPRDTTADDAVSITSFLPRWLVPGFWLAVLVLLGYLLLRARRLGPLVPEPMPVVVRAVETTESRGRLYRRTRDRQHAALMLRSGARRRLTARLAATPQTLAPVVAAACGRDVLAVAALLDDSPVRDDSALAALGRDLRQLEEEVAQP